MRIIMQDQIKLCQPPEWKRVAFEGAVLSLAVVSVAKVPGRSPGIECPIDAKNWWGAACFHDLVGEGGDGGAREVLL